jgi:hypothetical protein
MVIIGVDTGPVSYDQPALLYHWPQLWLRSRSRSGYLRRTFKADENFDITFDTRIEFVVTARGRCLLHKLRTRL